MLWELENCTKETKIGGRLLKEELLLEGYYIPEMTLPFSIGLFTQRRSEAHWHHYWEILYQVDGETLIRVGGEEFHSRMGEVTIIGPEQIHTTLKLTQQHTLLVMQFALSEVLPYFRTVSEYQCYSKYMFSDLDENTHFRITGEDDQILELIRKMISEYDKKSVGYELQIQAYLIQMFVLFIRNDYLKFPEISDKRKQALEKVKESILYVEKNYNRNIALAEVAQISSISIYNFCRTFKTATEYTFVEYLNHVRLREAEKMLLTTTQSISDIAYDIGFSSVSYFNRVFKKKYGCPPYLYRKQNTEQCDNTSGLKEEKR